ncbi:MAG TPA: bifunctional DNA primase/polymerase [Methanothrix sp.]|nr:bifunctional DNA primase/polymerase [Methanothrix sp.]
MDRAFERALKKIHPRLRELPNLRYDVILRGQKKPEGMRWSTEANYPYGHPVLAGYLAQGHNYGVLTGIGGLVVLDIDDIARLEALGIIAKLPETFTVKTGRGGAHYYFICPGLEERIVLEDPELKDAEGDPAHQGELQARGQQVVGPGSRHPNGNLYEVVHDQPIAKISKDELIGILAPFSNPSRKGEAGRRGGFKGRGGGGAQGLGDHIPIDAVAWPKEIKERAGAEVRGSHPLHGSTSGKNFAINTAKNCWHCFRHKSGGGPLEWIAVMKGIISCADAKPGCLR